MTKPFKGCGPNCEREHFCARCGWEGRFHRESLPQGMRHCRDPWRDAAHAAAYVRLTARHVWGRPTDGAGVRRVADDCDGRAVQP